MTFGVFVPPFRPAFGLAAAPTPPAGDWWTAGGAPTPLAVYQPKGAASLSASYTNLVNPGTYDAAPGSAPSWNSTDGWVFDGSHYLLTGILPPYDGAVLVLFSSAVTSGGQTLVGSIGGGYHALGSYWYGNSIYFANGGQEDAQSPSMSTGVLAYASDKVYRDGIGSHTIGGFRIAGTIEFAIGAIKDSGGVGFMFTGKIQAVAIWDTSTDHGTWIPAVSAAVALI